MKIAIYAENNRLTAVYEGINNPKRHGTVIVFDGGDFSGITDRHMLIDDDVTPSEELTPDMLQLDRKETIDVIKTTEEQQAERIANLEEALLTLMDMI
jgi:hypothetical protein